MNDADAPNSGRVVPLGTEQESQEPSPLPRRTSRLHSTAVGGMALAGVTAILSALSFVTVTWSGTPRRAVVVVLMLSILTFLTAGAVAVFSAARDTYARAPDDR